MDVTKREIIIPLIIGGLLGVSVARLQGFGIKKSPAPIQLEVLPYKQK